MIKFAKILILAAILTVHAKNTYNRKNTVKCKTIEYPEDLITILSCKWCGLRQNEPTHIIGILKKKMKNMVFENSVSSFF